MELSLDNVKHLYSSHLFGVKKVRVYGENNVNRYMLLEGIKIKLSNDIRISISEGYVWDLASVPRIFWAVVPPDSDAELAFLIHDYLYENRLISRKFADKEMLKWSKELNGTEKWSVRNIDNYVRYYAVRLFGFKVWKT